jgi:hypothetical protein
LRSDETAQGRAVCERVVPVALKSQANNVMKEIAMSNMSYCRFQNTDGDLADCEAVLEGLLDGLDGDGEKMRPLSDEELCAAKRLVERCERIVAMFKDAVEGDNEDGDLSDSDIEAALDTANTNAQNALAVEG